MADIRNDAFMRSLCMGKIHEEMIFPFPKIKKEESETLRTIFDSLKSWLKPKAEDFRKWDREGEFPKEFIQQMKEYGLFGLIIPEEYGGLGFSAQAYSRAVQEVGRYDASVAVTIGAHSSIGMRGLLLFGTDAQKKKYLSKLATGEMIAAFCLTEPGAGSDAAAIRTKAIRQGDHWILSGEKLWITNGGIADFFTVFAKTEGESGGKITAFIVTRDMGGVSHGPHEDKMGIRASSTTTLTLDNVKVPHENVLGEVGKGFKVAMHVLNSGRTGLGGGCVGGMKEVISLCTKQAKERVQFGKSISDYGLIKQKIGHMMVECYATEATVMMVASLVDRGYHDYAVEAAIAKVFGTECLWRTVDEGLQIAGGNGFMREFKYERTMRDCRINRIFEGTNEILRLFIALTAIQEVGSSLKEVASSLGSVLQDPIKGFGVMSDYAFRKVTHVTGFGQASLTMTPEVLSSEAKQFEEAAAQLASTVDRLLRKHGKNIVGKQFATRRLADIMIDLFALACVLSRVSTSIKEQGKEKSKKEIEIAHVFAGQASRRVRGNFSKIDDNDDDQIISLADYALEKESFPWDTLV